MKTKEQEILDTKLNMEDNKPSHLVEYTEVKDTPFTIAKVIEESKDVTYSVLLGNVRLNKELYQTEKECKDWIKKITWEKILQFIAITLDKFNEIKDKN